MHWRRKWHPLQCSCLENPRGGGAWWAAVYGVTQSQTWLKWLSSSSSSRGGRKWEETTRDVRGKPEESGIELAKKFYQVFHNILWKNLINFFGQPNIVEERHESFAHSFSFLKTEITLVYKFHVYNTVFLLYTLQHAHHWIFSFCHYTVDCLYPFYPPAHHPFPSDDHYSVHCFYGFVFVLFVFYISCERNPTEFVFLCLTYFT